MTNNFISDFEIGESGKFVKFIFTTRSEILNPTSYRTQFIGNSLDSLKDVELIKFDQDQIDDYLKKYVQISAKRVIKGLYEFIKEINQLKSNSGEFKLIWEMVEPTVIECNTQNEYQQMLFENREDDAIITKIKSHKVFQHLKDQQAILLKKDLQQLWSSSMFKQSIKNVNIEQLITTPFMLEIVVQVLPLMITRESNTYLFKEIFQKNLTILLRQSIKSKKYLSRYQQDEKQVAGTNENKKEKDKNIDKEGVKAKVIFEKLQEKRFFLNYSPLDKMSIQDDAIILRQNKYQIKNPDLVLAALKLKQFTVYEFYDCFIINYHNWQIQKLMQLGKIVNYDQFNIDVFNFSQSLALDLTINQLVQINIKKKGKLKLNFQKESQYNINTWEDQYINDLDDNLEYMKLIRSCALISIKGSSLSFNHKSIQEFLVAKFIFDEIQKMNLQFDRKDAILKNYIKSSQYNKNEFNISKENYFGVIALLKSQLENLPEIDELLIYFVTLSESIEFIRQASNSIYLLSQRNTFLGGMNFKHIKLKDTNLFALSFFGSDLSCSSFENVGIDSCNFNFCNLNNTNWDKIFCKEMPYLKGHKGTVFQVAFSHDGQLLVSGGSDSLVRIWDLNTFGEVASINHFEDENLNVYIKNNNFLMEMSDYFQNIENKNQEVNIYCVRFFQNSQKLVTAGSNKIIKIFNIEKFSNIQLLQKLEDHGQEIVQIIFSLDEKTMYSFDTDRCVIIWNVENILEYIGIDFEDSQNIIDVAFASTDDFFYAINGDKKSINFNEVLTKRCLNSLSFHDFNFIKLTLSQNNQYLAAVNQEGLIVVWDVSQYHIFNLIWYEETFQQIQDFQFSPDNQVLSILYKEMLVNKNFQICRQEYIKYENCDLFAFSQNDDLLTIVCDQTIYHIDLITNQMTNSIAINAQKSLDENKTVKTVVISKNQQMACQIKQMNMGDIMIFSDMYSFQKLFEINIFSSKLCLSSDQKWLVKKIQNSIIIQNLEKKVKTGARKKAYNILDGQVKCLAISQQNSFYSCSQDNNEIIVKDLDDVDLNMNYSLNEKNEIPIILAFSQNGEYLLVGTNCITLIKFDSNEEPKVLIAPQNEEYLHIATSYNDKMVGAVGKSNYQIYLWEIETLKLVENLKTQCNTKLLFSPITDILAFGSENKIIFYDYKNKNYLKQQMQEHENEVIDFAFSSNNQYFASLGKNSTIILQNQKIFKVTRHNVLVDNARFILFVDQQTLLTASKQILKIWQIQQDQTLILFATKVIFDILDIFYQESERRIIFRVDQYFSTMTSHETRGYERKDDQQFSTMIVYDFDEFLELTIINLENELQAFTISKDSQLIGYDNLKEIKILRLDGTSNVSLYTEEGSQTLAFSLDNRLLATFEKDNCLKIYSLEDQQIQGKLQLENFIDSLSFSENGNHLLCKSSNNAIICDISNSLAIVEVYFYQEHFDIQKDNRFAGFNTYNDRTIIQIFSISQNKAIFPISSNRWMKIRYSQQNYVAVGDDLLVEIFHSLTQKKIRTLKADHSLAFEFISNGKFLLVEKQLVTGVPLIEGIKNYNIIIKIMDLENNSENKLQIITPSKFKLYFPQLIKASKGIMFACEDSIWFFQIKKSQFNFVGRIYLKDFKFLSFSQQHICYKIGQQFKCLNLQKIEQKQFLKDDQKSCESIIDVSENQEFLAVFSYINIALWNLKELSLKFVFYNSLINWTQGIFLNNKQFIYSGEKNLYLTSIDSLNTKLNFGSTSQIINKIAYSNKNNLLATGDEAQNIILWDVKVKSQVATFSGHSKQINSIAFSPNCQIIASGGQDSIIRLWNVILNYNIASKESHIQEICFLQFSPDGLILASSSIDGQINLWNVQSKRCHCVFPTLPAKFPQQVTFSDDQNYLLTFGGDSIILWNIRNFNDIRFKFLVKYFPLEIYQANFENNSNILFFCNSNESSSLICFIENVIEQNESQIVIDEVDYYQVSQIDPLLAYQKFGKMEIVEIADLHTKQIQQFPQINIRFFFFSQDGQQLAIMDKEVEVQIFSKSIHKWEKLKSFSLKYQFNQERIVNCNFSNDNSQIIIFQEKNESAFQDVNVSFYDIKNAQEGSKELQIQKFFENIQCFLLIEDRKMIAIAHTDQIMREDSISVVNVEDFKQVKILKGHGIMINCMSLSFDYKYFSAIRNGGRIFVWNYEEETLLSKYSFDPKEEIFSISFVKNLSHILIFGQFRPTYLGTCDIIFQKCNIKTNNLSKLNIEGNNFQTQIYPSGMLIEKNIFDEEFCLYKLNFTSLDYEIVKKFDFIKSKEFDYRLITLSSNQTLIAAIECKKYEKTKESLKIWDIIKKKHFYQIKLKFVLDYNSQLHFSSDNNQIGLSTGKELFQFNLQNQTSPINYYFDFDIKDFALLDDKIIIYTQNQILQIFKKQNFNLLKRCFFQNIQREINAMFFQNIQREIYGQNTILVSNEAMYRIKISQTKINYCQARINSQIVGYQEGTFEKQHNKNKIIIYNTKMLDKDPKKICFDGDTFNLSIDEKLLVFASKSKFGFSDLQNLENCANVPQFEADHYIKKLIISKNHSLLATICDICIKIWDIRNQSNPEMKFQLLGKSKNEQFTFDSSYFCRQMEQQLFIINVAKCSQKEIILKTLCEEYIKGTITAQTIDNKDILLLVSQKHIYQKQADTKDLNIYIDFNPSLSKFVYSDVSFVLAYITFSGKYGEVQFNKNIYIKRLNDLEWQDYIENAHDQFVLSLSISSDGMLLLSGGEDYSIKIWDTQNLNLVARIDNLSNIAVELAFCPDGFYFASGASDGSVNLFIFKNNNNKKKQKCLLENFGNNKIGCVKVFSQQPLLQISKCSQEKLKIDPKDYALVRLFDQKSEILLKQ